LLIIISYLFFQSLQCPKCDVGLQGPQGQKCDFGDTLNIEGISAGVIITLSRQTLITNTTDSNSSSTGALVVSGGVGIAKNLTVSGNLNVLGQETITNTTDSTSSSTGALIVSGGVGIGKNLTVSGNAIINQIKVTNLIPETNDTLILVFLLQIFNFNLVLILLQNQILVLGQLRQIEG
jgi:hypothetical protein